MRNIWVTGKGYPWAREQCVQMSLQGVKSHNSDGGTDMALLVWKMSTDNSLAIREWRSWSDV